MPFELPELAFDYTALEPHIDAQTMEIHHTKHHQGYITKLNAVIEKYPELDGRSIEDLLEHLSDLPLDDVDKTALRNNGGGHANHSLFWSIIGPEKKVQDDLVEKITEEFGSLDNFKEQFATAAATQFGSGWAWLVSDKNGALQVYATPNQDSPLMQGHKPLLGLDVWEHAYYLKYQNRRPEYIEAWWNVLTVL